MNHIRKHQKTAANEKTVRPHLSVYRRYCGSRGCAAAAAAAAGDASLWGRGEWAAFYYSWEVDCVFVCEQLGVIIN